MMTMKQKIHAHQYWKLQVVGVKRHIVLSHDLLLSVKSVFFPEQNLHTNNGTMYLRACRSCCPFFAIS